MPRLHTEKTAKTFHDMKPLPHNTEPVYEKLALINILKAMTNHDRTDISMVPQDQYFHGPMMQTLERQQKGIISLFVYRFMETSICKTSSQPTELPRGYYHQHGCRCAHYGYCPSSPSHGGPGHLAHVGRTVCIAATGVPDPRVDYAILLASINVSTDGPDTLLMRVEALAHRSPVILALISDEEPNQITLLKNPC